MTSTHDSQLGIDHTHLDVAIADLERGEKGWAETPLSARRELLQELHSRAAANAEEWVQAALEIKGLDADSPLVGEEWLSGPYALLTGLDALAESLTRLESGGSPLDGLPITAAPGGRVSVEVMPHSIFDKLLLNGYSAQVWLQPGVDAEGARQAAGLGQRTPTSTQGVGLVLGAGNITSIAPLDVLYEIYAHNRVVVLKLNPIMDRMLPVFSKIFAPLIDRDLVRIVTGGADVGTYLTQHDRMSHIHMTGSAATHDAIVFGTGSDGQRRKAEVAPILNRPISSELGGVSPTIIFPGKWSKADLRFQAEHVTTQRLHNGGYNCIAAQTVVLSAAWPQKEQFVDELRAAMTRAPARMAYYPGSADRVQSALDCSPNAERLGPDNGRVLIAGLDTSAHHPVADTEYFAPVLGIVELPETGEDFARASVQYVNTKLVGTLGANIIAHPKTIRELGTVFDTAVEDLNYGTIAINAWTGLGYLTARATWGAFPGHTIDDVQSGIGVVHNGLLIDRAERTVVRGPFRPIQRALFSRHPTISPKPPWFVTNRTASTTSRRLTKFAADPAWSKLPAIFSSALRG